MTATSHRLEEEELMMQLEICINTDYHREVEKWKERKREKGCCRGDAAVAAAT